MSYNSDLLTFGDVLYNWLGRLLLQLFMAIVSLVQNKPRFLIFLFPLSSVYVYASFNTVVFQTLLTIIVFYIGSSHHTREKEEAFDSGLSVCRIRLTCVGIENEALNLKLRSYEEDKKKFEQTMETIKQSHENLKLANSWYLSQNDALNIELKRSKEDQNKLEQATMSAKQSNDILQRENGLFCTHIRVLKHELQECDIANSASINRFKLLVNKYKNQIETLTLETFELRCLKGDKNAIETFDLAGLQSLKSTLKKTKHIVCKEIEEKILYDKLEQEKIKLKEELNCLICLENPYNIAFIPCGHHKVCSQCSSKISSCPFCRKHITGRLVTF
eukprot:TRINITY_DN359_c0_g1_i3.p1 TRINITY_DN359_c0_g1~~TRINITY_DN359_c0_g1_i3.p1  ORF type:complete len:332 (-),score=36.14 TRINITY_DN359_c0_g1_i3:44-1039(-)